MASLWEMAQWFGVSPYKLDLLKNENDQNEKLLTDLFEVSQQILHPGRSATWFNERLIELNWQTPMQVVFDGRIGLVTQMLRERLP